jgi:hypothetical protein
MECYPVDSGPTGSGHICPGNPGLRAAAEAHRAFRAGCLASSPQSSDRACSARCVSAAAAARWRAACHSCWSLSPSPAAAARHAGGRHARGPRLPCGTRGYWQQSSAAAWEAAAWHCAEASRSLMAAGLAPSCRTAFSSPIRVRIAARRCPISARRLAPDAGWSSMLPACPLPAVSLRAWMPLGARSARWAVTVPCSCRLSRA